MGTELKDLRVSFYVFILMLVIGISFYAGKSAKVDEEAKAEISRIKVDELTKRIKKELAESEKNQDVTVKIIFDSEYNKFKEIYVY